MCVDSLRVVQARVPSLPLEFLAKARFRVTRLLALPRAGKRWALVATDLPHVSPGVLQVSGALIEGLPRCRSQLRGRIGLIGREHFRSDAGSRPSMRRRVLSRCRAGPALRWPRPLRLPGWCLNKRPPSHVCAPNRSAGSSGDAAYVFKHRQGRVLGREDCGDRDRVTGTDDVGDEPEDLRDRDSGQPAARATRGGQAASGHHRQRDQ
jgi:hypothetical protein